MSDPAITSPTVLLQRMAPLLAAILNELCERTAAIEELEVRTGAVRRSRRGGSALLAALEERAAVHERELRALRAELRHLGWELDVENPSRFVYVGTAKSADARRTEP